LTGELGGGGRLGEEGRRGTQLHRLRRQLRRLPGELGVGKGKAVKCRRLRKKGVWLVPAKGIPRPLSYPRSYTVGLVG